MWEECNGDHVNGCGQVFHRDEGGHDESGQFRACGLHEDVSAQNGLSGDVLLAEGEYGPSDHDQGEIDGNGRNDHGCHENVHDVHGRRL